MYDFAPFIVLCVLALAAAWVLGGFAREPWFRNLLVAGVLLRILGSTLRLEVIDELYRGVGDAKMYFRYGSLYAHDIGRFDFSFFSATTHDRWWGTHFVRCVTAFVVFFTGDSLRSAFLAFALLAYGGVLLFVLAFRSAFGPEQQRTYAYWVLLWPSLCFWPSSIGKDALILLALGMLVYGYVGDGTRTRWIPLVLGMALTAAIRPHVATPLAASLVFAELLRSKGTSPMRKWVGGVMALAVAAVTVSQGISQLGFEDVDIEGIQEEFEYRSDQTARGGSAISQTEGVVALPMAFVNVLFRPFFWEFGGLSSVSGLEMMTFWGLVIYRRKYWPAALKSWRENAFLRIAFPVTASLALLYGLAYANLGIIARQRVILFPFLLTLLAARSRREPESLPEPALVFDQPPKVT